MDAPDRRKMMRETFDTVASGYDNPALRFFIETARGLASHLEVPENGRVLDVASGTGNVSLEIAGRFPAARVTGVDLSPGMLAQARAKAAAAGLRNLEFLEMDMHELAFPDGYFDAVVSSFGIFFADDMPRQLRHMASKARHGGFLLVTAFHEDAFRPLIDLFGDRLESYGVERPPLKWKQIATEERVAALLRDAGLTDVRVQRKDHGYYLRDASQWWDVIWNAGLRSQVGRLSPEDLARFKEEHLQEVDTLRTEEGIRFNVEVLYASGISNR
ncbi:MAG: methyltransferase domain-containing protein [Nitrospirae bacterium]|nr:MAG: methyltransferase domain-containing protein [Nitrospirota bacterium]